jgi:hypothetical protein
LRYLKTSVMTEKKEDLILSDEIVLSKIYYVRGHKIMLDKDLAEMYNVQPIRLRQQVKRNADRFPDKFMFQLTDNEVDNMVSQNVIPSKQHLGGYLPYAFTEHGVLMLASILRSKIAMQVSVRIIETFVKMRELLSAHSDILLKLERLETQTWQNTEDIQKVFDYLKQLLIPADKPTGGASASGRTMRPLTYDKNRLYNASYCGTI